MRCLRPSLLSAVSVVAFAAASASAIEPMGPPPGARPMPRRYRPYEPYTDSYLAGYRYVPYPLNDPNPHVGPNHWVACYDYGFFGAKYRKPSKINVGFYDYIRSYRRGFVTP